ncbi:hypothetical protein F5Y19DRAFT_487609 [Xylariaceae sp. FL1651]|nr:hypothetical protein F5Y19DRAFT_487609 [Xylariaceae sp. FL1651]
MNVNLKLEKEEEINKAKRFNWLSRDNRGSTYISYDQFHHLPDTSFEFGADGFAGACNRGGELLHLSAPSKTHGLIFARGAFSSSLYACLARAQMEFGGSSTFGLRLSREQAAYSEPESISGLHKSSQSRRNQRKRSYSERKCDYPLDSSFRLGKMIERGCFNYRWPLNEYSLLLNSPPGENGDSNAETGTCTRFSFVKNGVCYQVIRLEQRCRPEDSQQETYHLFPPDGQVALEIGGPIYLQLLKNVTTSNAPGSATLEDGYRSKVKDESSPTCFRMVDTVNNVALEARVYQLSADGESSTPLELKSSSKGQDIWNSQQAAPSLIQKFDSYGATSSTLASSNLTSTDNSITSIASGQIAYKAIAKLHPPTKQGGGLGNRSETFIAAIRLVQSDDADEEPEIPSSEDMHRDVWVEVVRPGSVMESGSQATGAMWETILQWRDLRTDSMSEFTEISLIARCLEKILQVDLVPGIFESGNRTVAILSNPFMHPTVNLRSLFWKARFLVKAYYFLSRLGKDSGRSNPRPISGKIDSEGGQLEELADETLNVPDFSDFDDHDRLQMLGIADSQCKRILDAVEYIVFFLVELLSTSDATPQQKEKSRLRSSTPLMPYSPADESEFYYITITIWYVVKMLPQVNWAFASRLHQFEVEHSRYSCIPPDNQNFGAVDKRKIALLRWYHYGSLLSLAERNKLPQSWKSAAMKRKVYSLSNAATVACTGRTVSKSHYSVDDEIVDRLAFLARELGMEEFDVTAETVTSASIQRIRQREFTKRLNPGITLPNRREYNIGETCGPWEIHALCHNSRLNALTLESESDYMKTTEDWRATERRDEEITVYKNKVYQFLNSEATLISCWERAPAKMRSGWLRSEATAVLGSTLLDIHSCIPVDPKLSPRSSPQTSPMVVPLADRHQPPPNNYEIGMQGTLNKSLLTGQLRATEEVVLMRHLMARQREILKILKGVDVSPINWSSFRPPRQYHPDNFVNSLDDTPHLFRPDFTNKVFVPAALSQYAKRPGHNGFGQPDLEEAVNAAPGFINVLDILAFQQQLNSRTSHIWVGKSTIEPDIRYYEASESRPISSHEKSLLGKSALVKTNFEIVPEKRKLVEALFDSLVDQSVQHRVLTVGKLTEKLTQMLAFVIHPEAVTCLSNHILHVPRFSYQQGPSWTTSITVGSWVITDGPSGTLKHGSVMAKESIQLPKKLREAEAELSQHSSGGSRLWESNFCVSFFVSSIVLSTNAFGDFSKCTIISEANDNETEEKRENHIELGELSNEIWQVFMHQPQTARCLVFLHMLGIHCTRLSKQYSNTIEEFASIVDSTDAFLLEERNWICDRSSLSQLQLILWSLDSLYKFQNSLKTSFNKIFDAKRELCGQINEQAGSRSESLQGMCQEYVAKFESSVVELTQVNEYLESNIALTVRFRDALSGTLALRDSRVGLEQNETSIAQNSAVQKLTYLTIGYLPIGLIAAIFAIPEEQHVVFQPMGKGWFVGAIFIMSAATYTVAVWLGDIIRFFESPNKPHTPGRKRDPPNLWKLLTYYQECPPAKGLPL